MRKCKTASKSGAAVVHLEITITRPDFSASLGQDTSDFTSGKTTTLHYDFLRSTDIKVTP